MGGRGAGGRPQDAVEAVGAGDDGLEDGEGEARVPLVEAEEGGSEGFELGEEEVVYDHAREELDVFVHRWGVKRIWVLGSRGIEGHRVFGVARDRRH